MSGLVLSLKANEKFLVNGALLINGPKRSQIRVGDEDVCVLRLSDALHPDEVTTPVRRVYYAAQLYLSRDVKNDDIAGELLDGLNALEIVFEMTEMVTYIRKAQKAADIGRYYSVLVALKPLLGLEAELLGVDPPVIAKPREPKKAMSYATLPSQHRRSSVASLPTAKVAVAAL